MNPEYVPGPYRTNGKLDSINGKLDALIEGQKETNDNLKEINSILKGGLKETNDNLKEINSNPEGRTERDETTSCKRYSKR